MPKRILLIDDDELARRAVGIILKTESYNVIEAATAEEGLALAIKDGADLVLLDIVIPAMGGEEALSRLREQRPEIPVIILTGSHDTDLAVRCIKAGATDFLTKPYERLRLATTVNNTLRLNALETRLNDQRGHANNTYHCLYGASPAMQKVFEQLRVVSQSTISVLLEGASGTGKELAARALHRAGPRQAGPFVALNCGAIPESLLESELFGHERGAFTGAHAAHPGCFEQADGGTLFLDEIGEMRVDMQVRLLRALENREIRRLGATKTTKVDVRIVTATNRDLRECVKQGTFREDLYFRLAVFRLALPALKERGNDIQELAERFMLEFSAQARKRLTGIDSKARAALGAYAWPGNVRELRNVMERAVLLAGGTFIALQNLPEEISGIAVSSSLPESDHDSAVLTMEQEEERIFRKALRHCKGDVTAAASLLAIGRATLYRRISELNIDVKALCHE